MDMKRLVMTVVAAGAAVAAVAMPTKKELQTAQAMVNDVTAADVTALKTKAKTPAEVAAKHMELAGQAGNEAEKYVLLQGAFKLYAKAGDYEGAANALGTMNREIADMNPEVIVEIYNKAIFSSMKEKAPKLHAIKEAARRQVSCRKQLAKAEAAVKANPKDAAAQKKLGECHAELGNWPKALDAFALAGGALAKTAAAEKDGSAAPQVSGDFWWDYESGDEMSTYRLHAAELYRTALADDSFKGLARTRTEQRVKEAEASGIDLPTATSVTQSGNAGCRASAPKSVANRTFDLGCERKLEMIACPAGTFIMGEKTVKGDCNEVRKHQVKITRPFWLSKVAVTAAQWSKIIDEKNAGEKEDFRYDFPKGNTPLSEKRKFMEKLNRVFAAELPYGYVFRFPTEAELTYAMTSGGRDKVTELSIGVLGPSRADKEKIAKEMVANGATLKDWPYKITQTKVGLAQPNEWGFYDIINNGEQLVLDRIAPNSKMRKLKYGEKKSIVNISYEPSETDPLCWEDDEKDAKSLCVDQANFWGRHMHGEWGWVETFRVCLGPDLVAEKKAKGTDVEERVDVVDADKPVLTADKAPTPKCKMVNGRPAPMKFELAKGVDLELEGCPAGKFTMGYAAGMWNDDGKAAPKHGVTITRPFWIGKFQVTRGQAKSLDVTPNDCYLEVQSAFDGKDGDTCSAVMTFDNINAFCRKLTEKFAAKIPTGYVFRLASNAEWEYASKAGDYSEKNPAMLYSGHKESPYILTRHDKLAMLKKKNIEWKDGPVVLPAFPGGLKRPNGWGVFDMLGNHPEVTMDRIPKNAPAVVSYGQGKELGIIRAITYAKQETDPVLCCESDWNLLVRGRWDNYLLMEGIPANRIQYVGGFGYAFRVCLGPDLVAEKKAKK